MNDREGLRRLAPAWMGTRVLAVALATVGAWILISLALGLGLPRVDGGPTATVLGATALAVGIGFVVAAGVLLFQLLRGWALLILVPGILLLLVGIYGLSIALAAVHPQHTQSAGQPAGAARVVMTTTDGVRLSGWYYPSQNGAAVVLRHGTSSTAADTATQAAALNEAGYGVLTTDARRHGDSGGQGMEFGWYGDD